jgi:hypothetical protein
MALKGTEGYIYTAVLATVVKYHRIQMRAE